MIHKATSLIGDYFDSHDILYRIESYDVVSSIEAAFNVEMGPTLRVCFISVDEDNDVAIRIYGIMHKVTDALTPAILEACNTINREVRFLKFYLNEGDVIGEFDIPLSIPDENIGACCYEIFFRIMRIMEKSYHYFPEAVYANPQESRKETILDMLNTLKDLRDNPVPIEEDSYEDLEDLDGLDDLDDGGEEDDEYDDDPFQDYESAEES